MIFYVISDCLPASYYINQPNKTNPQTQNQKHPTTKKKKPKTPHTHTKDTPQQITSASSCGGAGLFPSLAPMASLSM